MLVVDVKEKRSGKLVRKEFFEDPREAFVSCFHSKNLIAETPPEKKKRDWFLIATVGSVAFIFGCFSFGLWAYVSTYEAVYHWQDPHGYIVLKTERRRLNDETTWVHKTIELEDGTKKSKCGDWRGALDAAKGEGRFTGTIYYREVKGNVRTVKEFQSTTKRNPILDF